MKRTAVWLYRNLEELLGGALLMGACLTTTLQVASRYLLNNPLTWTEEASTFMFVWMVFLGASLALKREEHFVLKYFVGKLPGTARAAVEAGAALLTTAAALLLTWYGGRLALESWTVTTPALGVPRSVPLAAVALGGALMTLRAAERLTARVRRLVGEGKEDE